MKDLTLLYTAPDLYTAELLKAFLEGNNIKILIKPAYDGPQGISAYTGTAALAAGPHKIFIFKEQIDKAQELLNVFLDNKKT